MIGAAEQEGTQMDPSEKGMLRLDAICIVVTQVLFFGVILWFPDVLFPSRSISYQTWNWYLQQPEPENFTNLFYGIKGFQLLLSILEMIGVSRLLFGKPPVLPIRLFWKITIPAVWIIVSLVAYYYFEYQTELYPFCVSLLPMEILSLVLLGLLWVGKRTEKTSRRDIIKTSALGEPHDLLF